MNLLLGCPVGDDIGDKKAGQQYQGQRYDQPGADGKKLHDSLINKFFTGY
jgi:hypothetical protein